MKILIAPDKFKGSLTATQVCEAVAKGIKQADQSAEIFKKPLADGGDGSLDVLQHYLDLQQVSHEVNDPLMRPMTASYYRTNTSAYIELSVASGLVLLKEKERNCMLTSSYGTGELIADAIKKGIQNIYLFIGGSATNDGGIGIANALGYHFYDDENELLSPIGENLDKIKRIDKSNLLFDPTKIAVQVICDVNNPLYGKNGAAYIYAAQKGANEDEIATLDIGLKNLAEQLIAHHFPDISQAKGAGAAGGIGGGAIAFLGAKLVSGIQTFLKITDLENTLKDCDFVITGEGKLDRQSEQGKVVSGVCDLAKKYKKPVIVVCGDADLPVSDHFGISKIYTVLSRSTSLEDALQFAPQKLEQIAAALMNDYKQ